MSIPGPGQSIHLLTWRDIRRVRRHMDARNVAELALHTTDDLRPLYQEKTDDVIRLPDGIISRVELVAEIRWRVWLSSLGYKLLFGASLVAAGAAVAGGILPYLAWSFPHG